MKIYEKPSISTITMDTEVGGDMSLVSSPF